MWIVAPGLGIFEAEGISVLRDVLDGVTTLTSSLLSISLNSTIVDSTTVNRGIYSNVEQIEC